MKHLMTESIRNIAERFDLSGAIDTIAPLGDGLINETFKVSTLSGSPDYVLQRINDSIFTDVELLQRNIVAVTAHIRARLEAEGADDIDRRVLRFIPLKGSDRTWLHEDGQYWRMSVFIRDAFTYNTVNPEYSYHAGKAFGNFEAMLADMSEALGETIPDFHNMELRSRQLEEAMARDKAGRMSDPEVMRIAAELSQHASAMCKAERMYREGLLPKRICHCDSKVNNMLFDSEGRVLCVIDLDTVMPGFIFSDFGDFLRTAANTLDEDDPRTEQVAFRMDIFEAFTTGYLESAGCFLTREETDNLPFAARLFPYMQAVRFFTDYLNGDLYYKTSYPEHNLVRTRNQMALFRSAFAHEEEMAAFVSRLTREA